MISLVMLDSEPGNLVLGLRCWDSPHLDSQYVFLHSTASQEPPRPLGLVWMGQQNLFLYFRG